MCFSYDQCNQSCIQANDIKKHMLRHSGEKPFACNQWSFSCRRPNRLKYYMISHTGEKPFACKKCEYSCRQSRVSKTHMKKHIYEASTPGKWFISVILIFKRGGGQWRKYVWQGPVKKICPKCMIWRTSDVIWGDLGTFWSDFNEFKMQNHSVIKRFVESVNV